MNQLVENLKKSPSLLMGVIALLVCLGFGFLRTDQLVKLTALENELNAKLDTIGLNIKNSNNIEQDIQKLETLVNIIDERLFVSEERSTNIDFFYSFEERLGIVISEVQQLDEKNPRFSKDGPDKLELYSVVDYSITVSGTFHEILRFMYEIYQIDTIARIAKFQVDAANNENTDKLLAKIYVSVFAKE